MKVAAICDFPYWERKIGSAVRFDSLCATLAKVCDLTVISTIPREPAFSSQLLDMPYAFIDRCTLEEASTNLPPAEARDDADDRQLVVHGIKHFVEAGGFDAVLTPYFNRKWLVQHLHPRVTRIIDTIDCQFQRTRSFARHGLTPTFWMTPEQEGSELDYYDIALAMSEEDFDDLSRVSNIPIVTAPFRIPGHDKVTAHGRFGFREGNRNVLFVAADSEVNRLTLAFLIRDILPLVCDEVILNVVGNVQMPDMDLSDNVTVARHEGVDDLAPIYGRCALALNPTYAGGGVKTKTMEALAFCVPVLTSDEGARGLRHLIPAALIANDKETFALCIKQLLASPELRAELVALQLANLDAEDREGWLPVFHGLLNAVCQRKREYFS